MQRLNAYPIYLISRGISTFAFASAFTTSAVYRFEAAGLDPLQLVLLGTALEASVFLFEIPTGVVADLVSRRLSVVIGYVLIGLGMILEGTFPIFITILLAQIVWGAGDTFISGAEDAWLADEVGESRLTAVYLRGSQIAQIAVLAGIGANVLLANRQLNFPFFAGGLTHLLLAAFLALFMPETNFEPTPAAERNTWHKLRGTFQAGMQAIRIRPLLVTILGISFFYGLYSEALDRLWQPQFLENVTFPTVGNLSSVTWFGILNAAIILITLLTVEIARRRTQSFQHRQMTALLATLSAVISGALVVFGLAMNFPLAMASYSTVAITRRTLQPLYSAWINRGIPSAVRATVLSTFGQMDAIGQIAGGPAVGLIANRFGMRAALVLAGLMLSPVLLLYRRAAGQTTAVSETETADLI
ncbi:MAG: MFS transporter [Candidatus Promineifilaceae bacterium]|jgi:DHA3 family tetracycline resistance protein-like MFS transporter